MILSASQKLEAVERELKLRRRVYPSLILRGRMKQSFADLQVAIFESIADDYRRQTETERLI